MNFGKIDIKSWTENILFDPGISPELFIDASAQRRNTIAVSINLAAHIEGVAKKEEVVAVPTMEVAPKSKDKDLEQFIAPVTDEDREMQLRAAREAVDNSQQDLGNNRVVAQ